MFEVLGNIEFRDSGRALQDLLHLSENLSGDLQGRLQSLLAISPDPDDAVHLLERLRREQTAAFCRLTASAAGLQALLAVFSHSRFLSEAVLVHPEWIETLPDDASLYRLFTAGEYEDRLESLLTHVSTEQALAEALATFRRREMLRIVLRDVLGIASLAEVTEEISNLADSILDRAFRRILEDLVTRHGAPSDPGFSIIALGKLGGRELNYSSDIDLLFLYSTNGETSGPHKLTNKEFFKKAAGQLTSLLSAYTSAGNAYRVDLRLRPDGRLGEICVSLDGAKNYYQSRARDWELQMLIKARVAAGEREPGQQLLDFVEPLIYSSTLDFSVVESASATRERISEKLAKRRASQGLNIKLAPGGIRDIEFLVQCLQRLHGGREKWVKHGGTLLALGRLRDKDLLSSTEFSRLASAYIFLRDLEHRLQFYEDRQVHVLPLDAAELTILARKMPGRQLTGSPSADSLVREVNRHLEEVQEIYERVIHAQQPMYYAPDASLCSAGPADSEPGTPEAAEVAPSNLVRFLDQRAPNLAIAIARNGLRRGRTHLEHFLERVVPNDALMDSLNSNEAAGSLLDIFEHSPHFSEELIRSPEWIEALPGALASGSSGSNAVLSANEAGDLRRFFRREMFRIQAESICLAAPIFATLEKTSDLADAVIAAAYGLAVEQTCATLTPSASPKNHMTVITMGRLGMREFDLDSDADLVFVIPDAESAQNPFWTRVAERIISIISAYTGNGVMFAVDTRLRPNGREGPLVQSESAYKDYFAHTAQAWEGITYMKCRAVAGDVERGTNFLNELQEVDWRRYGQSGRSRKQLLAMRLRVEKEQGGSNPLKAGRGGYYDIDFALMYLRLKGAGIFFKVLNTPARIDVVEKTGHLERPDAEFLREAATFYRAVDHGLRVSTGRAEGSLPTSASQLETLTALVRRWVPEELREVSLPAALSRVQARTREFFDRLFHV